MFHLERRTLRARERYIPTGTLVPLPWPQGATTPTSCQLARYIRISEHFDRRPGYCQYFRSPDFPVPHMLAHCFGPAVLQSTPINDILSNQANLEQKPWDSFLYDLRTHRSTRVLINKGPRQTDAHIYSAIFITDFDAAVFSLVACWCFAPCSHPALWSWLRPQSILRDHHHDYPANQTSLYNGHAQRLSDTTHSISPILPVCTTSVMVSVTRAVLLYAIIICIAFAQRPNNVPLIIPPSGQW
jgi:uncharacterized membrane protein YbaN (DUF454 family)